MFETPCWVGTGMGDSFSEANPKKNHPNPIFSEFNPENKAESKVPGCFGNQWMDPQVSRIVPSMGI